MPTLWSIRAGRSDEAHDLFVKCNWIALDRSVVGDLRELKSDVQTVASCLKQFPRYADLNDLSLREKANQLLMFLNDVRQGDSDLYSSKLDQSQYFGRVVGEYVFIPNAPNGSHIADLSSGSRRFLALSFRRRRFSRQIALRVYTGLRMMPKNFGISFRNQYSLRYNDHVQE